MGKTRLDRIEKEIEALVMAQKRTDEQLRKTEKVIENLGKQIGNLTDGWGRFVEGIVEPSVHKCFKPFGIDIKTTSMNLQSHVDGKTLEVDILATGKLKREKVVLFIEVKSSLGIRDIQRCERELAQFFNFFDEYKGYKLLAAVAGVRFHKHAKEYAMKRGFYVLAPSDEVMVVLNKPNFKPRIWKC